MGSHRLSAATLHVTRKKGGTATTHQISATELRALRRLQKEQDPKSAFVFINERGTPFDRNGFNWMVKRAGKKAGLSFQAHAHMLRHAAGYTLANAGKDTRSIQAYLGHKDIRHTVRYTELSPTRFRISGRTERRKLFNDFLARVRGHACARRVGRAFFHQAELQKWVSGDCATFYR